MVLMGASRHGADRTTGPGDPFLGMGLPRSRSLRPGAVACDPDRLRTAQPPGGHDLTELGQPLDRGVLVDLRAQPATGPLAVQVVGRPRPAAQPFPRVLL